MNRNARIAGAVAVVAVVLGLLVYALRWRPTGPDAGSSRAKVGRDGKMDGAGAPGEMAVSQLPPALAPRPGDAGPPDDALATYMQDKFGATLYHKHTQIKAIEKLIEYLMKYYPDDWKDRVYDYLKMLFPDRADELYEQFQRLQRYNDWMKDSRAEIMKMSPEQRRETLWDLRHSIFGDDANEIWSVELKQEKIQDALTDIAKSPNTTVEEKLDHYMDAVSSAYGEQAEKFIEKRQTELMNVFLSVDAVQDDLHALAPEQRAEKLKAIRKTMGLDEAALQRWDDLDRARDQAWNTGEQYMAERDNLSKKYEGQELENQLNDLRDRTFGQDAEIIKSEEDSGYYRYQHRRAYGNE